MNKSKMSHPLYNLIYTATDNYLSTEDEVLNKQICSEILRTNDAPKLAVKIIHKIINKSLNTSSYQSLWYSLLLLDTAVKNTDSRFCAALLSKEFLCDLVKIVDPKYSVPDFVQEKLFYTWKDWISTLSSVNGHQNLLKYYKNIEISQSGGSSFVSDELSSRSIQQRGSIQSTMPDVNLAAKSKINHDIDVMETNLTIFSDTIRTVSPETVTADELKFLEELHETLLKMQERINEVLPSIVEEDMINQLIQVNDRILFTSAKYKRFLISKSQVTLAPGGRAKTKSASNDNDDENYYYMMPNAKPKLDNVLSEIYAENSLPSYLEATVAIEEQNKKNIKEINLISFDDEESCVENMNLPSVPMVKTSEKEKNAKTGMSSTEFDEFIERITKNQDHVSESMGDVRSDNCNAKASRQKQSLN